MKKYRILKHECFGGRKVYEAQKRFLGFLWWCNFNNIDAWETGIYNTLDEAERAIEQDMYVRKTTVVKTY